MNQGYSFHISLSPLTGEELDLYALAVLLQRVDDLPEALCHQVEDSIAMQVAVVQRMQAMQTGFGVPAGYQARFDELLAAHVTVEQTAGVRPASVIPLWGKRLTMAAAVLLCFFGVWATISVWYKPSGLVVDQLPAWTAPPVQQEPIAAEAFTVRLDDQSAASALPPPPTQAAPVAVPSFQRDSSPLASAEAPAPMSAPFLKPAPAPAETAKTAPKSLLKPLDASSSFGPPTIKWKTNKKINIELSEDCLGRKGKKLETVNVEFEFHCGRTNEILGSQTVTDLLRTQPMTWQVPMDNLELPDRDKVKILWRVVPADKSGVVPGNNCLTGSQIVIQD